jgi:uncharacterized membrane protein
VFAWSPVSGTIVLDENPGACAIDMSADGRFIVGDREIAANQSEVFRWSHDTGFVGLGHLPGGDLSPFGQGGGCSEDASIVVGSSSSSAGTQAFLWEEGSIAGMVPLGDLPGGAFESHAWSSSEDGSVVVGYSAAAKGIEAFRWTVDDGMVSLGNVPGSYATDVSADGSVVVGYAESTGPGGFDGFIWTQADGMRNFQTVLMNEHGLAGELAGWHLDSAVAITPDGRTIVGSGINPAGDTEAYLVRLKPFAPSDVNRDGVVDIIDLLVLLADWT